MIIKENLTNWMTILEFANMLELKQPFKVFYSKDTIPSFEGTMRDLKSGNFGEYGEWLNNKEDFELFLNSKVTDVCVRDNTLLLY